MDSNQIENILAEALQSETIQLKKQKITPLIRILNEKAVKIQQQQNKIFDYNEIITRYINAGFSRKSAFEQGYQEGKISINITTEETLLLQEILDGYEAVNKIRQLFTKQKIFYQIGIGVGSENQQLLQTSMNFNELQSHLYIEYRSDGYSIRISNSQAFIKDIINKRNNESISAIKQLEGFVPGASTLYSAVYRFFTDNRLSKQYKVGNWGNFYQAYRLLYNKSTRKNLYRPRNNTIAKAFTQVLAGGGKEGSFIKGGDVGLEQDKFGNNPTLTSVKSTVNALKELAQALEEFVNTGSIDTLKNLLTKKQAGTKTLRKAREIAIKNITQILT